MRPSFIYLFIYYMALALAACQSGPAPVVLPVRSTARQARIEQKAGGGALYRMTVTERRFQAPEAAQNQDQEQEKAQDPAEWLENQPEPDGACDEERFPCGCTRQHDAEAALIFYPGVPLRVEWRTMKGEAGSYPDGFIEEAEPAWRLSGEAPHAGSCEAADVKWDSMHRLLGFSLNCEWLDEEEGCRGEDAVVLRYVDALGHSETEKSEDPRPEGSPIDAPAE